jgi:hypothetical protein
MKLSKADEKSYPKLHRYIKNTLPDVIKVPKIVKALEKNGEIKLRKLKVVLTYGTDPTIKVTHLTGACGEFTPDTKSNELRIHKPLVEKLKKKYSKEVTLLVGASILHELAHWGDDQDGKDLPGEEGELFEKAAYGHVIPCTI